MISVQRIDEEIFEVKVDASVPTTHRVTVSTSDVINLTGNPDAAEDLLRAAFAFLLEREPNTSILREFDLPVIGQYFPGFEKEMRRQWGLVK